MVVMKVMLTMGSDPLYCLCVKHTQLTSTLPHVHVSVFLNGKGVITVCS